MTDLMDLFTQSKHKRLGEVYGSDGKGLLELQTIIQRVHLNNCWQGRVRTNSFPCDSNVLEYVLQFPTAQKDYEAGQTA